MYTVNDKKNGVLLLMVCRVCRWWMGFVVTWISYGVQKMDLGRDVLTARVICDTVIRQPVSLTAPDDGSNCWLSRTVVFRFEKQLRLSNRFSCISYPKSYAKTYPRSHSPPSPCVALNSYSLNWYSPIIRTCNLLLFIYTNYADVRGAGMRYGYQADIQPLAFQQRSFTLIHLVYVLQYNFFFLKWSTNFIWLPSTHYTTPTTLLFTVLFTT